MAALHTGQWV